MMIPHTTIDTALMARFQRHLDEGAFGQLVSTYAGPALAVANQLLHDHALAEDAVQEAFVRVVKRRDHFMPSQSFASWFYTILRHVCFDMIRKRTRQRNLIEQLAQAPCAGYRDIAAPDDLSLLNALPARERCVLELRVVHGLSFGEVAHALNISEEAAKKRAQRGLRRLREKVNADHGHRQAV